MKAPKDDGDPKPGSKAGDDLYRNDGTIEVVGVILPSANFEQVRLADMTLDQAKEAVVVLGKDLRRLLTVRRVEYPLKARPKPEMPMSFTTFPTLAEMDAMLSPEDRKRMAEMESFSTMWLREVRRQANEAFAAGVLVVSLTMGGREYARLHADGRYEPVPYDFTLRD